MSEKGQEDGSTEGTGTRIGIDGTAAGPGGSAADQSGPHQGDTRTRDAPEWQGPPQAPEWQGPPQAAEWQGPPQAPEWQGPPQAPEWQGPEQESAEAMAKRIEQEQQKLNEARDRAFSERDRQRDERGGQTSIDPPSLQEEGGPGSPKDTSTMTPEELEQYNKDHPTILEQARPAGDKPITTT